MVKYKYNQPYYELQLSECESTVHVLSFEGQENISRLFRYQFELISDDPELDPEDILNKKATFVLNRGDEDPIKIHGIISQFSQRGRTPSYVFYQAVLVPKMWLLKLTHLSQIFQKMNVEKIVEQVLKDSEYSGDDYKFELNESYPEMEYVVQYRESNFDFINRRLEHFGIFYYFDHEDDNDTMVFIDSNDSIPGISSPDDIFYNPNKDPLSEKETIFDFTGEFKVVTGKVRLKDYNYLYPTRDLKVESQIKPEDPGVYYDYGGHFKDTKEGEFLAKLRNEEILAQSKIFKGISDCRLFQAGYKFKIKEHYCSGWDSPEYILTKVVSRGTQRGLFAVLPKTKDVVPTYENFFEAIPIDIKFRPPRISPIPRIPGIMTSKLESGAGDEYAFIDDQGRYKMKVPFDLSDVTDGKASRPIRLKQPYSGPGFGVHFPNHADTEIVWSCIDGHVDRPMGLGTVPNPSNSSPSASGNKWQSVIRTAGKNELTFDDKTGSENVYLHGTKDWTIAIENDKTQTIGNNETSSVGNDRSRDVGNNEKVKIGSNQNISVGSNRDKSVGSNQSESVGANKTIKVGGNHTETVTGNMSQTVSAAKTESVAIAKTTSIGAAYQITVGAAMNESIGAVKAEEIGADKAVSVGANSSEKVGANKSVDAGKNIQAKAGKDIAVQAGKTMMFAAGDDLGIKGDKKAVIEIKDQLTIKVGSASITFKKNGDIMIKGKKINLKGSGDIIMKAKKIKEN